MLLQVFRLVIVLLNVGNHCNLGSTLKYNLFADSLFQDVGEKSTTAEQLEQIPRDTNTFNDKIKIVTSLTELVPLYLINEN